MTTVATMPMVSCSSSQAQPSGRQHRLAARLLPLFGRYIGAPIVIGREHIPTAPFVICANHRSHMDSIVLIYGLGLNGRCALLAARDYFVDGGPWQRLLGLPFPMIAVDRTGPGVSMLRTIREAHSFFRAGGQALITYPEGSRQSGSDIAPFKRGASTLALALGRPVLPVFVEGTDSVLAKGRRLPVPGRITLVLAQAIDPGPRPDSMSWRERSRFLTAQIESAVRGMAASRSQ
jgi:1-acyl-sn-glycerol-3-phosphate acyltransferase